MIKKAHIFGHYARNDERGSAVRDDEGGGTLSYPLPSRERRSKCGFGWVGTVSAWGLGEEKFMEFLVEGVEDGGDGFFLGG